MFYNNLRNNGLLGIFITILLFLLKFIFLFKNMKKDNQPQQEYIELNSINKNYK